MNSIVRAANRVLQTGVDDSEADIRSRICSLLDAMEIDEYKLEHRVNNGSIDIYLPRHRCIFEVKRTGLVDDPKNHQSAQGVSPFVQLDNYLKAEIKLASPSQSNNESDRRWTGVLTDGKVWHHWSYEHRENAEAQPENLDYHPQNGKYLSDWLKPILLGDSDLVGKPWIPSNPVELFEDEVVQLRKIHDRLTGDVHRETVTKKLLWGDMLRSSGMYPATADAQGQLFVLHSFLVALARGVIWTMSEDLGEPDAEVLLGDGFVAWIVKTTMGRNWADKLLNKINEYDWRMRQGDVLRPLYESFVDANDRRDFGEVYTPDWLAELMVKETLDDDWCVNAISSALNWCHNKIPVQGKGVLDPACGSGTFLYHAAKHLLNHKDLLAHREGIRAQVVTRLVNGIDIHPVACEFSRATILRALPCPPPSGTDSLRIFNGDALQLQGTDVSSLFAPKNGEVHITSPGGTGTIILQAGFYTLDDFSSRVHHFTTSAKKKKNLPEFILDGMADDNDKESIAEAHRQLTNIIQEEGNSVWNWYFVNSVGPYVLSKHKVDRIVSNPPWVKISNITVPERKLNLRRAAERAGLWQGGHVAPHFDIAQLFIKKCREIYLADKTRNPASWIVKASALKAQHWEYLRNWRSTSGIEGQSVDMIDVKVFGGGDAKRCCLLFDVQLSSLCEQEYVKASCPREKPVTTSTYNEVMELGCVPN